MESGGPLSTLPSVLAGKVTQNVPKSKLLFMDREGCRLYGEGCCLTCLSVVFRGTFHSILMEPLTVRGQAGTIFKGLLHVCLDF